MSRSFIGQPNVKAEGALEDMKHRFEILAEFRRRIVTTSRRRKRERNGVVASGQGRKTGKAQSTTSARNVNMFSLDAMSSNYSAC